MGSRHRSLEMTDVEDVAELLSNFEDHNGVKLAIAVSVIGSGKARSLFLTAAAFLLLPDSAAAVQLGSANVTCSDIGAKSLGGALTRLLYALDSKLAQGEFELIGHSG